MLDAIKWQHCLPHHLLSRAIGYVARCENPWVKNTFIETFMKRYGVDLTEALVEDPHVFSSFNDFFTRALKPEARPIADEAWVSPADGTLSEFGVIDAGQLLQAKGHSYSVYDLLAGDTHAESFIDGHYFTVYLAPRDYHRVHMPVDGRLLSMTHVPGDLFSVNAATAAGVPRLFARNERVICLFDTRFGVVAVILVGAMIVASIATVWHGQVTPVKRQVQSWHYGEQAAIDLQKGQELGRFYLGSTAIVLTPASAPAFASDLLIGQSLKMGQTII